MNIEIIVIHGMKSHLMHTLGNHRDDLVTH